MKLDSIRENVQSFWGGVAEGWRHLLRSASGALTRFIPGAKTRLPSARRLDDAVFLPDGPAWALLGGDVFEDDRQVVVRLEVPGLEKEDLSVEVSGDSLVVSGEKRFEDESSDGRWRVLECAYGSFRRVVPLPATVKTEKARAHYRNGVLKVELPKVEEGRARRTSIRIA